MQHCTALHAVRCARVGLWLVGRLVALLVRDRKTHRRRLRAAAGWRLSARSVRGGSGAAQHFSAHFVSLRAADHAAGRALWAPDDAAGWAFIHAHHVACRSGRGHRVVHQHPGRRAALHTGRLQSVLRQKQAARETVEKVKERRRRRQGEGQRRAGKPAVGFGAVHARTASQACFKGGGEVNGRAVIAPGAALCSGSALRKSRS